MKQNLSKIKFIIANSKTKKNLKVFPFFIDENNVYVITDICSGFKDLTKNENISENCVEFFNKLYNKKFNFMRYLDAENALQYFILNYPNALKTEFNSTHSECKVDIEKLCQEFCKKKIIDVSPDSKELRKLCDIIKTGYQKSSMRLHI